MKQLRAFCLLSQTQTKLITSFYVLIMFSVISVFAFRFLSFWSGLHRDFQVFSASVKSRKVLPF